MNERIKKASEIMFLDFPDFINIKQLQEMLGIKRTKAYELIMNKEIKSRKVGKDYKIMKINVIAYMLGEEQI